MKLRYELRNNCKHRIIVSEVSRNEVEDLLEWCKANADSEVRLGRIANTFILHFQTENAAMSTLLRWG